MKTKNNTEKLYNSELDKWVNKSTLIKNICHLYNCTEEEAENHLEYAIKIGVYYTEEDYNKHFAPYEN